jgi:hypothetical protein
MFARIRNFFAGRARQDQTEGLLRQLEQLKKDLDAELPLADLRPVLIPSSILASGDWFGPHHYFAGLPVSLAWAYMRPENSMQYLSKAAAEKLAGEGIDWRSTARHALFEDSKRLPWTFKPHPQDPSRPVAGILRPDALGASRLFCYQQLLHFFPSGFQWFVPERWSAFLLSPDAPPEIQTDLKRFVQQAHNQADVPMSLEPCDHLLLMEALAAAGELEEAAGN